MPTFIMLTRLSHDALKNPRSLETLSHEIAQHIRRDCPEVHWKSSFVVLGPADYVDIFTAPDNITATKIATIIRTFGHATTEVWPATEWGEFQKLLKNLSPSLISA